MIEKTKLPDLPGCYMFLDGNGDILYAGKAKSLKKRVASYFRKKNRDHKTGLLLNAATNVDYIVTDTEVEALILENTLIKKNQPKYNIDLKDAKNYAYIHITDEKFPRIGIARKARGSGSFFGPFVSAKERDYVLAMLKKIFRLRSCQRLPRRACLRYHIGSCSAPCIGKIESNTYREAVNHAANVLRGNTGPILRALRKEMSERSRTMEFERALEIRDQICALEHLSERQHMSRQKKFDEDVIHYIVRDSTVYLILFNIYRGTLAEKHEFVFDEHEDFFEEFLIQYYSENEPPVELILPHKVSESFVDFLSKQKGRKVAITIPRRGEKRILLELARKNIEVAFFGGQLKLEELQKRLRLPDIPVIIECFDISHLSGTAMVGSMIQYRFGKPDKRNYRRFRIKTVDQIDDVAAIGEIIMRRYNRLLAEGGEFPDLIIIDGGKGQLSKARSLLEELGLKIPVISIAKREEEIYIPGFRHPLPIGKQEPASLFIQEIRDEAHRFAITYNRLLRKKKMVS